MTSTTTAKRAISALVQIMLDNEPPADNRHSHRSLARRRIEACEHLLDYECPKEVIEEAKAVLISIVEDGETPVDTKLTALKVLRRVESRKVIPGRAAVRDMDVEIARAAELVQRRSALVKAGFAPPYPDGYADDLYSPDYVPLPDDDEPVQDIGLAQ